MLKIRLIHLKLLIIILNQFLSNNMSLYIIIDPNPENLNFFFNLKNYIFNLISNYYIITLNNKTL